MTKMLDELLNLDSTVPIGSMALGVANEDSDLDLCVYNGDLDSKTIHDIAKYAQPESKYMYEHSLLLKYSKLYADENVDVFVFTDSEKLAIISKVMYTMKTYPKFILKIKWIRVAMFRGLLKKNGYLDESNTTVTD